MVRLGDRVECVGNGQVIGYPYIQQHQTQTTMLKNTQKKKKNQSTKEIPNLNRFPKRNGNSKYTQSHISFFIQFRSFFTQFQIPNTHNLIRFPKLKLQCFTNIIFYTNTHNHQIHI